MPPVVLRGELYLAVSIPRRIRRHVLHLVPIGQAVWQLPQPREFVTPKTPRNAPWGIVGRLVFSICPFHDESTDENQSWCQSVQPFDSFPRLLNLWPPTPPPPNCFLVHWGPIGPAVWQLSQTFECLTPNPPPECPLVFRGAIWLVYVHSQIYGSADVCQI